MLGKASLEVIKYSGDIVKVGVEGVVDFARVVKSVNKRGLKSTLS